MDNRIDILNRGIGVNYKNDKCNIALWAPNAQQVHILLNDLDKRIPLKKEGSGYWTLEYTMKPENNYTFIIDDKAPLPDPASLFQPRGVHGPSQVIDLEFAWTDNNWNNRRLNEYVLYELHTGTFKPEGTFASIEEKIDYVLDLGITAIEIMPVAQFPGTRNWGYDGVYPFAVQDSYGGARGLQHLVDICHKKGMAVVLDVVYNHIGPEGNYLGSYGPYFTDKYHTPWGSAINYDDAWCDGVRRYFIENALMWFRDFHIDALRMDAVHAICDFSPKHILRDIKEHVDELMKLTGKTHYLIVECDLNDNRFINPIGKEGYGMDAQWMDEFHHSLRVASGNERNGYYSDFNGVKDLAKSYRTAYVYDGIYSPFRHKTFGSKTDNNAGQQFVVFSQNHDQVGNRLLGERTSALVSFEMQKLLAGAVMISSFIPLLFMGEEWSDPDPFMYFISHTDPQLVEAVRKGRKEEFASFHMQGEAPDPQSEETFNKSKLQWELQGKEPHRQMLNYYKALIALRKHHPALCNLVRENLDAKADKEKQTVIVTRWYGDQQLSCLLNFSKQLQQVALPEAESDWQKIFDSADPQWNGPASAPDEINANTPLSIPPESILIYMNKHV